MVVACRSSVIRVFKEAGFTEDVIYEEVDREAYIENFSIFKKYVKKLDEYEAGILLHVRASYSTEDAFIHAVRAKRKICVRSKDVDGENSLHAQYFINNTYDEIIKVNESEDQLTRYGTFLKRHVDPEYKSKIYELPVKTTSFGLIKNNYFLLCPGASSRKKAWPAEKYTFIVDDLLKNYSYTVVLCGDQNDEEIGNIIEHGKRNNSKLVNLIGKSNLLEWFSLVQNARLVIANESGAVHVAAASRVSCVCIAAQEFGESFLPYRPELIREQDILPVVVRSKQLACFYCKKHKRHIDESGNVCYVETGTFPCLDRIDPQQVMEAIHKLLK